MSTGDKIVERAGVLEGYLAKQTYLQRATSSWNFRHRKKCEWYTFEYVKRYISTIVKKGNGMKGAK